MFSAEVEHEILFLLESGTNCLVYICHALEMANKTNHADVLLITLQYAPLLTPCLPVTSADNFGKQFGPRSGPTNRRVVGPDQGPNCLTF